MLRLPPTKQQHLDVPQIPRVWPAAAAAARAVSNSNLSSRMTSNLTARRSATTSRETTTGTNIAADVATQSTASEGQYTSKSGKLHFTGELFRCHQWGRFLCTGGGGGLGPPYRGLNGVFVAVVFSGIREGPGCLGAEGVSYQGSMPC